MAINPNILKQMVSITQFNRGQATKIFGRARKEGQIIVLKNNEPEAIILSPDEYTRMSELIDDYELLLLAEKRLANHNEADAIPHVQVLEHLGLTEADIDAAEELEIE